MITLNRPSRLILSALALCALAQDSFAQTPPAAQETTPAPKTVINRRRHIEPNLLAPELYADRLTLKFVLVDLPGANDPGSTWEGSYKLYFVSEAEFEKVSREVMRKKSAGNGGARMVGWDPSPADFPEKILLAEGAISKKSVSTPQQRIHLQENVAFKDKIPAELRTKGAHLLTAYSVKVYDARLKVPVYDSGIFLTFPFDDQTDPEKIATRTVVYTNFYVSPKGEVWESQLPRKDGDTSWF